MLQDFCDWLSDTSLSVLFQTAEWFVPLVQTIHIVAIAVLLFAVCFLSLRLIGISSSKRSLGTIAAQSMPWIWNALAVLLLTGILLTITEPARELLNNVFRAKMVMVVLLAATLLAIQSRLRRNSEYWTASAGRRGSGRAVGIVSLLLVACIVTAGRWIAYV